VSWVHDTGYGPALDHEGGVADVVEDGTDPSTPPDQIGPRVIGWRSACQCGWRGTRFSLRSEWPSTDHALASEEVEEHLKAEWERHLRVALPVLAIHDLTRRIAQAQDDLVQAVRAARAAGVSWTVIGEAADVSERSAQKRWSGKAE
jgi:hypothetical protein